MNRKHMIDRGGKVSVGIAIIALSSAAMALGPLRGVLNNHMDADEVSRQPKTAPSIPQAYELLASEAELQLVEVNAILAWAKQQPDEAFKKRAYELLFAIDEQLTTPVSTIAVDAWELGKLGDRYIGYSQEDFWQIYHALTAKQLWFHTQIVELQGEMIQSQGITLKDPQRLSPFSKDKTP